MGEGGEVTKSHGHGKVPTVLRSRGTIQGLLETMWATDIYKGITLLKLRRMPTEKTQAMLKRNQASDLKAMTQWNNGFNFFDPTKHQVVDKFGRPDKYMSEVSCKELPSWLARRSYSVKGFTDFVDLYANRFCQKYMWVKKPTMVPFWMMFATGCLIQMFIVMPAPNGLRVRYYH